MSDEIYRMDYLTEDGEVGVIRYNRTTGEIYEGVGHMVEDTESPTPYQVLVCKELELKDAETGKPVEFVQPNGEGSVIILSELIGRMSVKGGEEAWRVIENTPNESMIGIFEHILSIKPVPGGEHQIPTNSTYKRRVIN